MTGIREELLHEFKEGYAERPTANPIFTADLEADRDLLDCARARHRDYESTIQYPLERKNPQKKYWAGTWDKGTTFPLAPPVFHPPILSIQTSSPFKPYGELDLLERHRAQQVTDPARLAVPGQPKPPKKYPSTNPDYKERAGDFI